MNCGAFFVLRIPNWRALCSNLCEIFAPDQFKIIPAQPASAGCDGIKTVLNKKEVKIHMEMDYSSAEMDYSSAEMDYSSVEMDYSRFSIRQIVPLQPWTGSSNKWPCHLISNDIPSG